MSSPHVSHTPRTDATPEGETSALAAVYGFILESHAKKKAGALENTGDGAKGPENDRPASPILPRR